jgi:microcystin-dependent protein
LAILKIPTAKIFEPLLAPARYKGVYGGRGSGKSHFFGELLVETCQAERGTLAVCIREAQRTLAQSSKRLIESKIASLGVGSGFKLFTDKIETPGDGLIIFRGMQDHTAESIKSLEGFRIAWIDEAQTLSARSLALLRPTIRAENSELWASWNPYNVPLAAGMDYWGPTTPNSAFAFPVGQAISRTTYAALFAIMGTTYGNGDGSTTFNLPDKTGRVSAMKESSGTRLTSAYFGGTSTTMGAVGGAESKTLVTANLPAYTPVGSISNGAISISHNAAANGGGSSTGGGGFPLNVPGTATISASQATSSFAGAAQGGTSTPLSIVQPTIISNYIMRII